MERLTPVGPAGVAVYRFRPEEIATLADRIAPATALAVAATGRPARASLRLGVDLADDVLVVRRGDDTIEVHAHGSAAIDAALQRLFGAPSTAARSPAERLLATALGEAQLALALEQCALDFGAELRRLAGLALPERRAEIAGFEARSRVAMALATPVPLHLIGRQNAGKSTLFNRLVGRDRSLAGATPGLTRDAVVESVVLDGYPYDVHDHAGEGVAGDAVDATAIARSRASQASGWRLLLIDASQGPSDVDLALARTAHVVVATKSDLLAAPWPAGVPCMGRCSPRVDSVAECQLRIGAWLRAARGLPAAGRVGGVAALDGAQLRAFADVAAGDR